LLSHLTPIDQLKIHIKHEDLQKLDYNRSIAINRGRMNDDLKSLFVSAQLEDGNTDYDIDLGLTGFLPDHFKSNKWSMYVKLKDKNNYYGMKKFKLLNPKTRHGINDWLVHELAKREGLITLRNKLVEVVINGDNKGIYYLVTDKS